MIKKKQNNCLLFCFSYHTVVSVLQLFKIKPEIKSIRTLTEIPSIIKNRLFLYYVETHLPIQ